MQDDWGDLKRPGAPYYVSQNPLIFQEGEFPFSNLRDLIDERNFNPHHRSQFTAKNRQSRSFDHHQYQQNEGFSQFDDSELDPSQKSNMGDQYNNENTNELGLSGSYTDGTAGQSDKNENSKSKHSSINNGRWTHEEHLRFLEALRLYGKDWNKVQDHISTRTSAQTRSHAQKYFNKLCKKGNMRDLAIFDALLSSKRRGGETDLNFIDQNYNFPMNKTKSISKNYNTRLFKTAGKYRENEKDIFYVEKKASNNYGSIAQPIFQTQKSSDDYYKNVIFLTENKKTSIQNQFLPQNQQVKPSGLQQTQNKEIPRPQQLFQVTKIDSSLGLQSQNSSYKENGNNEFPEQQDMLKQIQQRIHQSPQFQENQQGVQYRQTLMEPIDEEELRQFRLWKEQQQRLKQNPEVNDQNNNDSQARSSVDSIFKAQNNQTSPKVNVDQIQMDGLVKNMARWSIEDETVDKMQKQDNNNNHESIQSYNSRMDINSVALDDNDPRRSDKSGISQFFHPGIPDMSLLSQRNSREAAMNIDEYQRFSGSGYNKNANQLINNSMHGYDSMYSQSQQDAHQNMRNNRLGLMVSEDIINEVSFDDDGFNLGKNSQGI
ncbi:myb-like dna-binding shaqkyf class family protein [Stylonychia lemnae]|uniref:Myb-like dna-binding shaqkyf class family protein n=1 Tax=Stylonychia lemnae TaxID=5949 RepID=A0A078B059_STYLE|nr:myb-like dna-binding shaqkyf class family protein [Stylonychia lemnae]|eukprot:CDW87716.1 myb-like dna-binding shaqkyf class family protein [Stylonychia lemnae]